MVDLSIVFCERLPGRVIQLSVEHRPGTPGVEGTQIASDGAPRVCSPRWDHNDHNHRTYEWMVYNGKSIYKWNHSYFHHI